MGTLVIGDIHGCFSTLEKLLRRSGFDPSNDRLWLVGDLVNRGPRSLAALRWAREEQERLGDRMIMVLGNHDVHLLRRAAGLAARRGRDTLDEVLEASDRDALLAWLVQRPLLHREDTHLLVHAGLLPQWSPAEAEAQARRVELGLRDPERGNAVLRKEESSEEDVPSAEMRRALAVFTKLRTCTPLGKPCSHAGLPEEAPEGCLPWFDIPQRRSRDVNVIIGHWAALGLLLRADITALDTGCVWGQELTAIWLENRRVISEPNCD